MKGCCRRSPPTATREQLLGSAAAAGSSPRQATVIMTALNISCEACAARIKSGLQRKFGKHIVSVSPVPHLRMLLPVPSAAVSRQ